MRKRIIGALAVAVFMALLGVGSFYGSIRYSEDGAAAFDPEKTRSWSLYGGGKYVNEPYNTTLNTTFVNNVIAYQATQGERSQTEKIHDDMISSGAYYNLKNIKQNPDEMKMGGSLKDYQYLYERGVIMNWKDSYYWGMEFQEKAAVKKGNKAKIKVKHAPKTLDKILKWNEPTASPGYYMPHYSYTRVKWKSADPEIVTVNGKGVVTAHKKGKTKVTAVWTSYESVKYKYKFKNGKPVNMKSFLYDGNYYIIKKTCEITVK